MLVLVGIGCGLFSAAPLIGFIFLALGLGCFVLGSDKKRQDAEALFFMFGLIAMVLALVVNAWKWLTS